jgi:phosphomannomutase/phosphoglucomutase
VNLFGSSGVRGRALAELTPADVLEIAAAAGTVFGVDRAAVARDTRTTGRLFADSAAAGLAGVGCDVDRLGIVPTPALQAYCERAGVPGVMLTASHNPPEYNGLKLIGASGIELPRDRLETVETRIGSAAPTDWAGAGATRTVEGAGREYREDVVAAVDREAIADAGLTVALDPGHGAGALTSPDLFRDLGCRVLTVNAQPDGRFPGRDPEPVPANLGDLRRLVRTTDADLGVAHDGDADRAIFVDERGESVEGDASFAALAAAELAPGDTVVSAVNASQRLVDVASEAGAEVHLTPIGSTNIITAIREIRAAGGRVPVAGEGNGGVLFPAYRIARDGGYTAARFCELLARDGRPASDLIAAYDDYHNVRENVGYDDPEERARLLDALEAVARGADADLDTTDGYRLDFGDAWVLARPSGTEPVVRVYAEARDAGRARELADLFVDALADAQRSG